MPPSTWMRVLRHRRVGLERDRPRGRHRQPGLVAVGIVPVERRRRVPGHRPDLLQPDQHVGTPVLHGLELPDRPPELPPLPRVGRGGLDAPGRPARSLRRRQHHADGLDPPSGEPVHQRGGRVRQVEPRQPAGRVQCRERRRGCRPRASTTRPALLPRHRDRDHHDIRQPAAEHRPGAPGHAEPAAGRPARRSPPPAPPPRPAGRRPGRPAAGGTSHGHAPPPRRWAASAPAPPPGPAPPARRPAPSSPRPGRPRPRAPPAPASPSPASSSQNGGRASSPLGRVQGGPGDAPAGTARR